MLNGFTRLPENPGKLMIYCCILYVMSPNVWPKLRNFIPKSRLQNIHYTYYHEIIAHQLANGYNLFHIHMKYVLLKFPMLCIVFLLLCPFFRFPAQLSHTVCPPSKGLQPMIWVQGIRHISILKCWSRSHRGCPVSHSARNWRSGLRTPVLAVIS